MARDRVCQNCNPFFCAAPDKSNKLRPVFFLVHLFLSVVASKSKNAHELLGQFLGDQNLGVERVLFLSSNFSKQENFTTFPTFFQIILLLLNSMNFVEG